MNIDNLTNAVSQPGAPATVPPRLAMDAVVMEYLNEAVVITDANRQIQAVNPAFTRMSGFEEAAVLGISLDELRSDRHPESFYQQIEDQLSRDECWQGEIWNSRKNGSQYTCWQTMRAVKSATGDLRHYLVISQDLSEQQQVIEQIHYLSSYDSLTGLPNRNLFLRELDDAMTQTRQDALQLAVVTVRLKNYQLIGEGLGLQACDDALRRLAKKLRPQVFRKDGIGRVADDTLALLVPRISSTRDLSLVLQDILKLQSTTLLLAANEEVGIALHLGVSLYPSDATDAAKLLEEALLALHKDQAPDGAAFSYYTPELNAVAQNRLLALNDLRRAIEQQELLLYYQPKVKSQNGELVGTEALIRWIHPTRGFIPPSDFIPLAEEFGLIREIGRWVIEESCRQQSAWLRDNLQVVPVAINLSADQLEDPHLIEQIQRTLTNHHLDPKLLELELTESMLIKDPQRTLEMLKSLKALGLTLALDDFGTGHSSLSYLSKLPFDKLKIDRSFVINLPDHAESRVITNTIVSMAHNLQMTVVAEGVETPEQYRYLKTRQCEEIQGYYYSKPLPAKQFTEMLASPPAVDLEALEPYRQPHTLLLVDDERRILSSLRRTLYQQPYRILFANSAEEALEILKQEPVQVILSDQRMPNLQGNELLEQVKLAYPKIIRMILSGYTDQDSLLQAINRGEIYRFLTKPWQEEELVEAIACAFDKYVLQDLS